MRSILYSRLTKRSSSPRNEPRLTRYSCQRLALLSTLTPSSSSDNTLSTPLPSDVVACPRPVAACNSLSWLNIKSYCLDNSGRSRIKSTYSLVSSLLSGPNIYFICAKLSFQFSPLTSDLLNAFVFLPRPFASPALYNAVSITLPSVSSGARIPADVKLRAAVASCDTSPPRRIPSIRIMLLRIALCLA